MLCELPGYGLVLGVVEGVVGVEEYVVVDADVFAGLECAVDYADGPEAEVPVALPSAYAEFELAPEAVDGVVGRDSEALPGGVDE